MTKVYLWAQAKTSETVFRKCYIGVLKQGHHYAALTINTCQIGKRDESMDLPA